MFAPKKSVFDLTHDVKTTMDMGHLIPILNMECVPGDKFNISCETLLRFAPLIAPVMHRIDVSVHYFFVPNRILWDEWEKFIVRQDDGVITFPTLTYKEGNIGYGTGTLSDHLGLPLMDPATPGYQISALPFAAYQKVFNEYYRDQNLVPELNITLIQGNNDTQATELMALRKRAWEHDYFTACLPFAQKGSSVDIPLGQVDINIQGPVKRNTASSGLLTTIATTGTAPNPLDIAGVPAVDIDVQDDELYAQINGTEPVLPTTINDLRTAFKIQEWLEKNARGGTRYIENIFARFGVKSSDKRLQRPEYITGVKTPVIISEVLSTFHGEGIGANAPQGNMSGHGISVTSGKYGKYFCEEHGIIIGIMSVMPKTAYQQGIARQWIKNDPFDFYAPEFAHLGEQAVLIPELYADAMDRTVTFGYIPRFAEYKTLPSQVSGDFKTSLNFWHLGRIFETQPALNSAFIESDPTKRVFAVDSPDITQLYVHVLNKIQAVRPMPKYGQPQF